VGTVSSAACGDAKRHQRIGFLVLCWTAWQQQWGFCKVSCATFSGSIVVLVMMVLVVRNYVRALS
jgi:hypothetical protein